MVNQRGRDGAGTRVGGERNIGQHETPLPGQGGSPGAKAHPNITEDDTPVPDVDADEAEGALEEADGESDELSSDSDEPVP